MHLLLMFFEALVVFACQTAVEREIVVVFIVALVRSCCGVLVAMRSRGCRCQWTSGFCS